MLQAGVTLRFLLTTGLCPLVTRINDCRPRIRFTCTLDTIHVINAHINSLVPHNAIQVSERLDRM